MTKDEIGSYLVDNCLTIMSIVKPMHTLKCSMLEFVPPEFQDELEKQYYDKCLFAIADHVSRELGCGIDKVYETFDFPKEIVDVFVEAANGTLTE